MLQSDLLLFQDFLSGLQTVEELISKHLSQQFNCENVAINTSPLLNQPLVCKFDQRNSYHLSIERFMQLLMQRWIQEIEYHDEVFELKDLIIKKFNQLCEGFDDERIIELIREHRQKIVELLLIKTQIETKQKAGEFCKRIMNGFEHEMLGKFNYYVYYVLWTPYVMPLPQGICKFINEIFEKIGKPHEESISHATAQIAKLIENHFEKTLLDIKKQESGIFGIVKTAVSMIFKTVKSGLTSDELKNKIATLRKQRKSCFLLIKETSKYNKVITNERSNIEFICVRMRANDFLKSNLPFCYDFLILDSVNRQTDWNKIVRNLPKGLRMLLIDLNNKKYLESDSSMIEKIKNTQVNQNELILDARGDEALYYKLISIFIENCKLPLCLSIRSFKSAEKLHGSQKEIQGILQQTHQKKQLTLCDIDCRLKIQVEDADLERLVKEIRIGAPSARDLIIDLRGNQNILRKQTADFIKIQRDNPNYQFIYDYACIIVNFEYGKVIDQIEKLKEDLSCVLKDACLYLKLNASWSGGMNQDDLSRLVQILLIHASQISCFAFNIENSNVTIEDARTIALAIKNMNNLCGLELDLKGTSAGEEGATTVSAALKELKNILALNLIIGNNNIGDEGAKAVSAALGELKNISTLNLDLLSNSIGEEGAKGLSAALRELKNVSTLTLNLMYNNIGEEGAKAVSTALGELKNILNLNLNFRANNIGEEGAKGLSAALRELKNVSTLTLDLQANKIGEEGTKAMSAALRELENISTLTLDLQTNSIGGGGAKAVSAALRELKKISILNLNLAANNIGEEEAKAVSAALRKLKKISTLTLDLWSNNTGEEGATAVSTALRKLKNISALTLNLGGNKIGDEGTKRVSAALGELKNISTLILNLSGNNIGEEGKECLQHLKLIYPNCSISYYGQIIFTSCELRC